MQSAHPWRPNRCRADVCGRRQDERGHQLLWWLGQVCDVSLDLHGELLLGSGQKILQWLEKLIINLQIIIFEILHSDNLCWELWMFISIFCDLDLLFKVMRHFGCSENYTLTFNFHWVDSVWLLLDTEFEPVSHGREKVHGNGHGKVTEINFLFSCSWIIESCSVFCMWYFFIFPTSCSLSQCQVWCQFQINSCVSYSLWCCHHKCFAKQPSHMVCNTEG